MIIIRYKILYIKDKCFHAVNDLTSTKFYRNQDFHANHTTNFEPEKEHCRDLDDCWMTMLKSKWISQMISRCFLPRPLDTIGFNHKTNVTVILGLFTETRKWILSPKMFPWTKTVFHDKLINHDRKASLSQESDWIQDSHNMATLMKEKLYLVIADYTPSDIGILPFLPSQKLNRNRVDELHVSKGDFVNVIKKFPTGWWFAQYKGIA